MTYACCGSGEFDYAFGIMIMYGLVDTRDVLDAPSYVVTHLLLRGKPKIAVKWKGKPLFKAARKKCDLSCC